MIRALAILIVLSWPLNAKTVHIYVKPTEEQTLYTVDPALKVWELKQYIFDNLGFDEKYHTLAKRTAYGYVNLYYKNELGSYGKQANTPVMLYVISKDDLKSKKRKSSPY